jgi:hypothetical protein
MRDFSGLFLREITVTLAVAHVTPAAAAEAPVDQEFIDVSGEELVLGGRPLS